MGMFSKKHKEQVKLMKDLLVAQVLKEVGDRLIAESKAEQARQSQLISEKIKEFEKNMRLVAVEVIKEELEKIKVSKEDLS